MNLNKAFIVGRLTRDPELRSTNSGKQVANFAMATNRTWIHEGVKKEDTEFHNIVAWGKTADVADKYLVKGSSCLIEGKLQTRKWEDKEGVTRYTTEILCERLQLGDKPRGKTEAPATEEIKDADLPF